MAKFIPLRANTEYQETLKQTIDLLDNIEADLFNQIVGLATSGKWKKWSDEQLIGSVFEFTEEMLRNTGDKNVDLLIELIEIIINTREAFENTQN